MNVMLIMGETVLRPDRIERSFIFMEETGTAFGRWTAIYVTPLLPFGFLPATTRLLRIFCPFLAVKFPLHTFFIPRLFVLGKVQHLP